MFIDTIIKYFMCCYLHSLWVNVDYRPFTENWPQKNLVKHGFLRPQYMSLTEHSNQLFLPGVATNSRNSPYISVWPQDQIWHIYFCFPASSVAWYQLTQWILKLNGKQCRSRPDGSALFSKEGISGYSRTRVNGKKHFSVPMQSLPLYKMLKMLSFSCLHSWLQHRGQHVEVCCASPMRNRLL